MEALTAPRSLDELRDEDAAALYPASRLSGLTTALMGFAAAFHGAQDCVWVAEAGLDATCVDIDKARLDEMRDLYPDTWRFVTAEAVGYARMRYAQGARFDVVSLDPPTNLFQRVADETELWCSLARRVVIIGTGRGTRLEAPAGWEITDTITRSTRTGGVYWEILEPA